MPERTSGRGKCDRTSDPCNTLAGAALGVENAGSAIRRLLALGLFDDFGEMGAIAHAAANLLARPLAPPLDRADRPRLARAALPYMTAAWCDARGTFPSDPRGLAAAEIALKAEAEADLLEAAVFAGAVWLGRVRNETRAALALFARALKLLPPDYATTPAFVRLGIECADPMGEVELLERLLNSPRRQPEPTDLNTASEQAALDIRRAARMAHTGNVVAAQNLTREALTVFRMASDEAASAHAAGQIADILQGKGQIDEALRIRREEELPVFERLGDVRERAITLQKVAEGLISVRGLKRGDIQEIYNTLGEAFDIAQKLGESKGIASTGFRFAEILALTGRSNEALAVLDTAEMKLRALGDTNGFNGLGELRQRIRGDHQHTSENK